MSNDKQITGKIADRFKKRPWSTIIRVTLLVVAILFISLGIFLDEPFTVFTKAIYICLECIGVG